MSLGTRHIDDALTFYCTTTRFDTGAATDADSPPTYRVYEDETATPILTGTMALLDSANTAGLYSEGITLSAANGFEIGKSYTIYITGAVNSVTGTTTREFSVRGDTYARLGAPAGASVSADIAAIEAQTDDIGAAGAGLTAIPTVAAIGVGGIAATSFAAGAIDAAAIAADAIGASELAAGAVDEILDDTIGDGTITVRQALRVIIAGMAGKLSGAATTTVTIRNLADSADVVVATVDVDGNRSAVTVTP